MFAKGGEIGYADGGTSDYEYDPASQTYKKVVQAPTGAVDPIGINGSDRTGDSSSGNQPLSQQTIDFLDKEEDTPGARDARMGTINDFATQLGKMSIVGAIARGLMGLGDNSEAAPAAPAAVAGQVSGGPASDDGSGGYGAESSVGNMAKGGAITAMSYKQGGLKEDSFIIPADVLAALGNGSNDAGLMALNKMLAKSGAPRAEKIDGPGDGKSDSIPTSIEGKQPARVAKDEAYVPTEAVRRLGGGDVRKGAKKLYNLMARVRKAAHGTTKQQRTVNPDRMVRA